MRSLVLALAVLAAGAHAGMALNPAVTQDNIRSTICVPGWAATVRPPLSYTSRIKRGYLKSVGLPQARSREFELDHRIPLTLGGHPASPDNLWLQTWAEHPQRWPGPAAAHRKDQLEVRLKKLVCSGQLALAEAQECIYRDWQACAVAHPSPSTTAKGNP